MPLRKVIPGFFGIDFASLLLAFFLQLLLLIVINMIGGYAMPGLGGLVFSTVYMLIMNILGIYLFAMIVVVIVSWIAPHNYNPAVQILNQLLRPFLRPIQRLIPPVAGLDLSPMVFLMVLFIIRNFILPAIVNALGFI
jgi:YggT family protein